LLAVFPLRRSEAGDCARLIVKGLPSQGVRTVRCLAVSVLTLISVSAIAGLAAAQGTQPNNLGYNSYEGYLSQGTGLNRYFGPGVGYPAQTGDYFRRYVPPGQWGQYGFGTGHLGEGYGPYIYGRREGPSPPGLFDPLPGAYRDAPPPRIKVKNGKVAVSLPSNLPGVRCVTVTMVAFNNADLATQTISHPPFNFVFPVLDGVKNVRVRIDYEGNGLSATSYPLG
jgi:hypothetical protein